MKRSREILTGSLCVTLLAAAFCVWSAFGNDVNFCVTAGCSLYQDFTVGGVSLWWLGTGSFALLALLALLGPPPRGVFWPDWPFWAISACCCSWP